MLNNATNNINQIKSVIIGHAIGDALGVPVEFCTREELKQKPVTDMQGYGTYPVPAGAWSDDTSMSLAALDSLADGKVDFEEIMSNFIKWLTKNEYTPTGSTFDVGYTCLNAVRNRLHNPDLPATECGEKAEYANGNGSLMRIHPFALYAHACCMKYDDWTTLIRSASALTHAHERSQLGCLIYSFILFHLLSDPNKAVIRTALRRAEAHLRDNPEIKHYTRLFHPDFDKLPETEIKSTGYVADTLEAAVWCLQTTDSYRDCVLKAVNLGDDTDTVAAIAGGLAGALYGYETIPKEWRDTLIKRDHIERMCEQAGTLWATDH